MNLFQEMEVNYKDFIESANDFMDSCREYTNNNEDQKIFLQFGEIAEKKRWKDKIKAKIEEYREQIEKLKDLDIFTYTEYEGAIKFGQSLLEKE